MKHLIIIASGIALISSYSFAAEHNATMHSNLANDTIKIFSTKGRPCEANKPCLLHPQETKTIPIDIAESQASMGLTTTSMQETIYTINLKRPLPKNIDFTLTRTQGHNYLIMLGDGKIIAKMKNEPQHLPKK